MDYRSKVADEDCTHKLLGILNHPDGHIQLLGRFLRGKSTKDQHQSPAYPLTVLTFASPLPKPHVPVAAAGSTLPLAAVSPER